MKQPGPGGMVRHGTVAYQNGSLEALVEILADSTIVVDSSGSVTQVNASAEALLGWSRDDLVGQPVEVLVPEGLREAHAGHRDAYASEAESRPMGPGRELSAVRRDGTEVAVDISLSPLERDGERLVMCLLRDVSEMRDRLARMQHIVDALPGIFYIFDAEGRLRYWNRTVETLIGYSAEELAGKHILDFIHPDDRDQVARETGRVFTEGTGRAEYRLLLKDGRTVPHIGNGARCRLDGEDHLVGLAVDVSALRETERQLEERIAEVNELRRRLELENLYLREEVKLVHRHGDINGDSPAIRAVLAQVEKVATTEASVLLLGETGTGKELLAQRIHDLSPRSGRPLIKVNCAALPPTLMESELFGREKGAYTGAVSREAGRFELADGSTLFLDEVGELSLDLQTKLLRVLQEGEYERVGSPRTRKVDVRIVAATNRDLAEAVREGDFRKDLFYRLNVFPIQVPPLRERREDIPLLVWAFVEELGRSTGRTIDRISQGAMERLQGYAWPGNVRELRNVVERSMILSHGGTLQIALPAAGESVSDQELTLDEVQRRHIRRVLEMTSGRISGPGGAAELLGLKPTTLRSRMERLGLNPRAHE
ncbi:MAG: sigma 54-interacting transcriptional regulator [Acidobacteria bacterium]|nr:sigma 54-interacting transcriptional regulator [Acidobacteriota bacterium]